MRQHDADGHEINRLDTGAAEMDVMLVEVCGPVADTAHCVEASRRAERTQ